MVLNREEHRQLSKALGRLDPQDPHSSLLVHEGRGGIRALVGIEDYIKAVKDRWAQKQEEPVPTENEHVRSLLEQYLSGKVSVNGAE